MQWACDPPCDDKAEDRRAKEQDQDNDPDGFAQHQHFRGGNLTLLQ
jgi:hypothetical protein